MQLTIKNKNYDVLISELKRVNDNKDAFNEDEIKSAFKTEYYSKGESFIRTGDVPNKIGFIVKGLMKYYYIDPEGNEWIKFFSAERDFVASYASFLYQIPSLYNIEALENTTILSINYKMYLNNINKLMTWCIIARKYTEKIYYEKEKREASFLQKDASERYSDFLNDYKQLSNRISLKDTASFLGITPISLSRIRNKFKNKNG
ncbi:MAG: Crp/Fnr family transcriptional regulator [Spirochaetes bacterium]|nr:Crp/Fnr family transcriptional regulator [Spirochaetota bacterium]